MVIVWPQFSTAWPPNLCIGASSLLHCKTEQLIAEGGFVAEMFDRTYYRRKVAQNRQMAADAQTDHVRDVHLRLCDFYTLALSVSDDLAEPPVLMVSNS